MSPTGKKVYDAGENAPEELKKEFERLLGEYDYNFKKGDIVKGTIISMDSGGALVDIGAKTSAMLPYKEIGNLPNPQEVIKSAEVMEFFILREENEDGQLTLSRRRVFTAQSWTELQALVDNDAVIECSVTSVVKGGLLIDVMGLRGFVPSSHLRVKSTLEELVGQTLPFKILSLDQQRNNIILSHRKVMAEQMAEQRKELFADLQVGVVVEGEVVRLTDFGAFIDLGGVDGLLPLSQMSWRWVEHPSDILSIGEKVKVEVIGIDLEKQRVSLSIKSQFPDPWIEVIKILALNEKVEGTVTRIKHFGAFVEVYPGVEALLPSRDITEYQNSQSKQINVGDKIETYIVKFNPEERRISLSFEQLSEEEKRMSLAHAQGGGDFRRKPIEEQTTTPG
jgi:small subunit ribosomal protein S1